MGNPQTQWQRYLTFQPSRSVQSQGTDLGDTTHVGVTQVPKMQRLHITEVTRVDVSVVANLLLPGGEQIGPIDLPCYLNVPGPVHVQVDVMDALTVPLSVRAVLSDLPDAPNVWGATYTVYPNQATVPIPDAAIAVAVLSGATATFRDQGGNAIGTFTGPYMVARIRNAVGVSVSVATAPVIFYY